jgi:hypothetical protein
MIWLYTKRSIKHYSHNYHLQTSSQARSLRCDVRVENNMEYPVLAIHPKGFVQYMADDGYWKALPVCFIGMFLKRRGEMAFYDRAGEKWYLMKLNPVVSINIFTRFFFGLQKTEVKPEFKSSGKYSMEDIRCAMRSAVEADDDILTQFHAKKDVLNWVDKAESIARMFNLYRWITKDFSRVSNKNKKKPEPTVAG